MRRFAADEMDCPDQRRSLFLSFVVPSFFFSTFLLPN